MRYPCSVCENTVDNFSVCCDNCKLWTHLNCAFLKREDLVVINNTSFWFCHTCKREMFPFNDLAQADFLMTVNALNDFSSVELENKKHFDFKKLNSIKFSSGVDVLDEDLDPDQNFFNKLNLDSHYITNNQFMSKKNKNGFSLIHLNARGLRTNFENIENYLNSLEYHFDVVAVSETHCNANNVDNFDLTGYTVTHKIRESDKFGGVAIYVKDSFNVKVIESMTIAIPNILECLTIEICLEKSKNILISCVYRKCGGDITIFNEQMAEILKLTKSRKSHYLCGDFNIDLLKTNSHTPSMSFVDLMFSHGFLALINRPSRITSVSNTLIDNIFVNDVTVCNNIYSGLLVSDISDHLPIFSICSLAIPRDTGQLYRSKRSVNSANIDAFKQSLITHNWSFVVNRDVNTAYRNFVIDFVSLFNKHCPLKRVCIKSKELNKPWFTNGLRNACLKKQHLYKDFLKKRTKESEDRYKMYKNKLINIMRKCERNYYVNAVKLYKDNVKQMWNVLNDVIRKTKCNKSIYPKEFVVNGQVINQKREIANGFNDFFVNIGSNLAKNIVSPFNKSIYDTMSNRNSQNMYMYNVEEKEVLDLVKSFKNKFSNDNQNLNMDLIKKVIYCIVQPLTYIFNKSFVEGVFPDDMKIAKVLPLHKSGERNLFTNYRPVSILPQFSKILEKLFYIRLEKFVSKCNILNDSQYGFRSKRSTSMAVLDLVEKISNSIDKNKPTIGVFIDLKKAFDTVDHKILLQKLCFYGIRGTPHSWLSSYLSNRLQYVEINDCISDKLVITTGVPQGSILGPLLFILYINDICNVSKLLELILFADDTNIFLSGSDYASICNIINVELSKLNVWFCVNKLSLNISKTNYISFGKKPVPVDFNIIINDMPIERVYSTKFLGVIIDHRLNWKEHVSQVSNKLNKTLAIFYKIRYKLSSDSLYILYCSLFLPYINYCCEIWGNTFISNVNKIFILQKKCIRIIGNANYRDSTKDLFCSLKIIKFFDLVKLKTCEYIFRAINSLLPLSLTLLLDINVNNAVNTRSCGKLSHKYTRTTLKSRCLSTIGIKYYNSLCKDITASKHLLEFKHKIKTSILDSYTYNLLFFPNL